MHHLFPPIKGISRYDKVEVNVPNNYTASTVKFQDQPQLRSDQEFDIAIQAIETFTKFDQALSQTGVVMPTDVQLIATTLTLWIEGEQRGFDIPLSQLHRVECVNGAGAIVPFTRELQKFDNVQISWQKCTLNNPAANGWNTGGAGTFSFEFGVHYVQLPPGTLARLRQIRNQFYQNLLANNNG